jgi:5'-nucleotidase
MNPRVGAKAAKRRARQIGYDTRAARRHAPAAGCNPHDTHTRDNDPMIDWSTIDTVLLDMDGTLLDLEFDNVLWNQHVPLQYAERHGVSLAEAQAFVSSHCDRTMHTLEYYCLETWARTTRLDLIGMHHTLRHLIRYRPHAQSFLTQLRTRGKRLVLVTNAHRDGLTIKDEVTGLVRAVDRAVSSHDYAAPKESQAFWHQLATGERFDPARTLLIDDNDRVLAAAAEFGIGQLLSVTQPDSALPPRVVLAYPAFNYFDELLA